MTYREKLLDPRWQRLRLEVMQRDDFTCSKCFADKETLNVHHRHYVPGHEPWEYSPDTLETLCVRCHESETAAWREVEPRLKRATFSGLWATDLVSLLDALEGVILDDMEAGALAWLLDKPGRINVVLEAQFDKEFAAAQEWLAAQDAARAAETGSP